jgi:putative DNA primase/helicase
MPDERRGPSLEEEGRALVERLGGRWTPNGGMCRCPAHEDRNPSLSVRPGRTRLLLHCFAGCDASEILRELQSARLIEPSAGGTPKPNGATPDSRFNTAALRIWSDARSISGTPAECYLRRRGVETDSPQLRYHPRTPCGPKPSTAYRPALIAAVRDEAGLLAIHRTFIDPRGDGLAAIPEPRCGLGRFGPGAVRLGGAVPRLGLAEGIETALSATRLFGVPCWATLGTERFSLVSVPAGTRELLLFLDHDAGGRRGEALARQAFAHIPRIEAHYPLRPGDDWNDVLRSSARTADGERGEGAAGG